MVGAHQRWLLGSRAPYVPPRSLLVSYLLTSALALPQPAHLPGASQLTADPAARPPACLPGLQVVDIAPGNVTGTGMAEKSDMHGGWVGLGVSFRSYGIDQG